MLKFSVAMISGVLAGLVLASTGFAQIAGGPSSDSSTPVKRNADQPSAPSESVATRDALFRDFLIWRAKQAPSIDSTPGELCLSNADARKIWVREHLYWHTSAHCWDATPGPEWKKLASAGKKPGFNLGTTQPKAGTILESVHKSPNSELQPSTGPEQDALFREFDEWSRTNRSAP